MEEALSQHQAGRVLDAETNYREILANDQDAVPARSNLGRNLLRQGRHDEALVLLDQLVEQGDARAFDHFHRGDVLQNLKRPEEAEQAFRESVRLDAEDEELHERLFDLQRRFLHLLDCGELLRQRRSEAYRVHRSSRGVWGWHRQQTL